MLYLLKQEQWHQPTPSYQYLIWVYNKKKAMDEIHSNIKIILKQTEQSSYPQKYRRWQQFLNHNKADSDQAYITCLSIFLDYFPFNYQYWLDYIHLTKPENYQLALQKNAKSFQLWKNYLDYVKTTPLYDDKLKFRKQVERAILEVGADYRAGQFYLQYFDLLSENYRYEFFKKIFTRALSNLEQIYQLFQKWYEALTEQQISVLIAKQTKGRVKTLQPEQIKPFLTQQITNTFKKTVSYREKRLSLQSKIKHFYFNGNEEELEEDMKIWKQMIKLERENGVVENTSYCYERMVMAQTHDIQLWQEVIHYLENETNKYTKVLSMFRFNRSFFTKFNSNLYFYWCDLEERENPNEARKMYVELEKEKNNVEIILRHIQFEIRDKKWDNAKNLYDALIVQLQQNLQNTDMLCYILVEYANYVTKYYKDHEYPKTLLKSYFDYLPYNHYLFTNYLALLKDYEYNKEGYYDELMAVIMEGLKKAKKVMNNDDFQKKVLKMAKHHLRTALNSIYLIKMSERKLMDIDGEKMQK